MARRINLLRRLPFVMSSISPGRTIPEPSDIAVPAPTRAT